MAHLLGAESLHLEYPTRVVFDKVTIGLDEGNRIGVVGRNGDGKSTLLSLLAGRLEPDGGRVTRRRGVTLGMLDQSDDLDDSIVVSDAIVGHLEEHAWAGDPRVRDVIDGLVQDIPWDARLGELSGGQRRRVALATLLVGDWDVMFLDEPTNHLDVEGIAWLAEHLKQRWSANRGGLVVVTHDRWFLDEVSTDTWEVHDQIVEPFEGGYAAYILQRVERDRMASVTEQKRQNLARKELAWLRRGAPARTAKPKFRMDAAYELIQNEPPPRDSVALSQLASARLGKDVVDLLDVGVSYGDIEVLRDITWRIAPGERTGILGVNGAGKSTLLGLVAGTVQPTVGKVKRGKTIRVAMLSQQLGELADILNDRVSAIVARQKSSYVSGGKELSPGQLLERLGFSSAQLSTPVKDLSGGQRRRLQLLLILLNEPNVLILDEPTNDMDTDMLAAIEDLLDSWPGTLIVVSHDRYLLERVTDNQYGIVAGRMRHLPGGVDEYLKLRGEQRDAASTSPELGSSPERRPEALEGVLEGTAGVSRVLISSASMSGSSPEFGSSPEALEGTSRVSSAAPSSASGRRSGTVATLTGADLRNAQKELASVGRRLEKVTAQIAGIHQRFADHDQSDYQGLTALQAELRTLENSLAELESRWLELSELLG